MVEVPYGGLHPLPNELVKQQAGAMMDEARKHDPSEDEAAGDPAWLFAVVLVIVVLGLWAANSAQFESLITSLTGGTPS